MAALSQPSAIEQLIAAHGRRPRANATTITTHGDSDGEDSNEEWAQLCALALQVLHSLRHQHRWTSLRVQTRSPKPGRAPLARPLLSGLPPRRLYVHPDEQAELLQRERERRETKGEQEKEEKKKKKMMMKVKESRLRRGKPQQPVPNGLTTVAAVEGGEVNGDSGDDGLVEVGEAAGAEEEGEEDQVLPVREWVLPTHIRETWSLAKMARVFDSICSVPPEPPAPDEGGDGDGEDDDEVVFAEDEEGLTGRQGDEGHVDKWRQTKRLLLATMDDDSTVMYYIVHDGIVKPRQN